MKKLFNKIFRNSNKGIIIKADKYFTDEALMQHMRKGGIIDLGAVLVVME